MIQEHVDKKFKIKPTTQPDLNYRGPEQTDNKQHDIQYFQCEVNKRKYMSHSKYCQWNRLHEWWFENRGCIKSGFNKPQDVH